MLEHTIMRNIMRIASNSRRKPPRPLHTTPQKQLGFGHILDLLSEQDGLSQQQIAQHLDIRPQSASEAIAGLEAQGLVRRQVNEQDRRSTFVFITPKGIERQTELLNERIRNAKRIMEPLTDAEKETLLAILVKVTAALHDGKEEN